MFTNKTRISIFWVREERLKLRQLKVKLIQAQRGTLEGHAIIFLRNSIKVDQKWKLIQITNSNKKLISHCFLRINRG
jgi:hypothetical protein